MPISTMNDSISDSSIRRSSINKSSIPTKVEMSQHEKYSEATSEAPTIPPPPEQYAWSRVREYCQDAFSEFFGTFILLLFGDGVVAQVVLSRGTKGDYQSISWGWG